jgi:excisionase family DNA binding protein
MRAALALPHTAKPDAPITDLAAKMMLSREDAARLSGLPRSMICAAIESRKLKAIKTGAGWRIKRAELESYVRKL